MSKSSTEFLVVHSFYFLVRTPPLCDFFFVLQLKLPVFLSDPSYDWAALVPAGKQFVEKLPQVNYVLVAWFTALGIHVRHDSTKTASSSSEGFFEAPLNAASADRTRKPCKYTAVTIEGLKSCVYTGGFGS